MNHMYILSKRFIKGKIPVSFIIILKQEEHLHCWHIYGRIQTTRGRRKFYEQEQM